MGCPSFSSPSPLLIPPFSFMFPPRALAFFLLASGHEQRRMFLAFVGGDRFPSVPLDDSPPLLPPSLVIDQALVLSSLFTRVLSCGLCPGRWELAFAHSVSHFLMSLCVNHLCFSFSPPFGSALGAMCGVSFFLFLTWVTPLSFRLLYGPSFRGSGARPWSFSWSPVFLQVLQESLGPLHPGGSLVYRPPCLNRCPPPPPPPSPCTFWRCSSKTKTFWTMIAIFFCYPLICSL